MIEKYKDSKLVFYLLIGICSSFWGFSFFATTLALRYGISTIELLMMRWSIAAILFIALAITKVIKVDFKGKNIKQVLLIGIMQPCIYSIFETAGIGLTSTSESSILIATIPAAVLLVGVLFFNKKITKITTIAIFLAFTGVITSVIFSPGFQVGSKLTGYLVLMGAVISAALYSNLSSSASKGFSSIEITFTISVLGGIFFTVLNFASGYGIRPIKEVGLHGELLIAVIFLGVGCSLICYLIFNYVLSKLSPASASNIVANSTTSIGVISGIVFAGDTFGWYTIVGLLMTMTGVWLTTKESSN